MGFAYFRWNAIKLQLFGPTAVSHGWNCSWCRDEWYAMQRRRRNESVMRIAHTRATYITWLMVM